MEAIGLTSTWQELAVQQAMNTFFLCKYQKFSFYDGFYQANNNSYPRFEKSESNLKIKNKGVVVYEQNFDDTDGKCLGTPTTKITTQVWNHSGDLELAVFDNDLKGMYNEIKMYTYLA